MWDFCLSFFLAMIALFNNRKLEDAYPDLDDIRQPVVSPEPGRDVGAGLGHLAAGGGGGGGGGRD